LIWSYVSEAPLFQVCPIRTSSGEWVIITGGVEETVLTLSAQGSLLNSMKAGDVVRHIRKGDILGDGKDYVAIATASTGLQGKLSMMLFDPDTRQNLWFITDLGQYTPNSGNRFFSMIMIDVNDDDKKDIVVCGRGRNGEISGYNYKGERIMLSSDKRINDPAYRMNLLSRINMKDSAEYIFGLYGNYLIVYNNDGSFKSLLVSKYDFSNGAFDPETNTYYLGSSPSGGDGIYALHLDNEGWQEAFRQLKPVGRLAQIEKNVALMKDQVEKFKRPDYQRSPGKISLNTRKPKGITFNNISFNTGELRLMEKFKDQSELWCRSTDRRYTYDMTQEEILKAISGREAEGGDFTVWAGHGDAFYMSPSTMEKILEDNHKHFKGFLLSEMSRIDSNMKEVVLGVLMPLAEKCSKAGKTITIRNKNIFWNATVYLDFWKETLLNPKFENVFIPSLEETNCRTQELSLAGRAGLWQSGYYDHWADRLVTDNACFDRFWEWSSQQILTHYIRQMVLHASMGADIFSVAIHQGPLSEELHTQMIPVYEMLDKGVIAIPKRDELLSVSDLCLGMRTPSDYFLKNSLTGGEYDFNVVKQTTPLVFDRLKTYWAGAPLLDHDFSYYGYGCERRMLNFLPKYPYGLVAIVPDEIDLKNLPVFRDKISTDGQYLYDSDGKQYGPVEYKQTMLEKLQQAASRLPVLVKGDVAWSVVRIDPAHVRVTLVDPGYTDPDNREAEIILQHIKGIECSDILSGEKLEITDQKIRLSIPAGIFRIVDIKH